jgi:hypothetical protein
MTCFGWIYSVPPQAGKFDSTALPYAGKKSLPMPEAPILKRLSNLLNNGHWKHISYEYRDKNSPFWNNV